MTNIKKILLLLVDDDEVDREMIRRSLDMLDAEIDEVDTCEAFLKIVGKKDYDLILLDFKLPDGDGLAVAKKVRAKGITTPMILITGFGSEDLHKQSIEAGLLGYITKDKVTPDVIIQIILGAFTAYRIELERIKQLEIKEEAKRLAVLKRLAEINELLKERIDFYKKLD
jgi:CheY-like chemotaxis protein